MFSQISKPITASCRLVTMERIACTVDRVEMRICISIVGGAEVRHIKTIEIWGGREGWCVRFGVITLIGRD